MRAAPPVSHQVASSSTISSAFLAGEEATIRSQLSTLIHSIRKIAKDNSISSDSGDSAIAFLSSTPFPSSADRTSTTDSTASTITPEKLVRLSSQASALGPPSTTASKAPSLSISTDTSDNAAPFIFTQSPGGERSVVDSPSILRANEPFFGSSASAAPATPAPASPSPIPSRQSHGSLRASLGAKSLRRSTSSQTIDDHELQECWRAISRELKPIADVLRTDRLRTPLGSSRLPVECITALQLSLDTLSTEAVISAQTEILRVLANLCIDHEANRDIMHALSAASNVVYFVAQVIAQHSDVPGLLFSTKVLSLLRTAMGAVLNLQLEHIPTRRALLNAESLSTLTLVAGHTKVYLPLGSVATREESISADADLLERLKLGSTVSSWAWRVVQEVCEDEMEDKQQVGGRPSSNGSQDADDDVENLAKSLLSQHSFGDLLRPFLHYTPSSGGTGARGPVLAATLHANADDVEELVDTDTEILAIASELIEGCAMDDKTFRTGAVRAGPAGPLGPTFGESSARDALAEAFRSPLDLLTAFVEKADVPALWKVPDDEATDAGIAVNDAELSAEALKTFAKAKASLARAVVAIAGEDANMTRLFNEPSAGEPDETASTAVDPGMGGWFIDRLKAWMRYDAKVRDDLVSCGMLALGNLARTDSHCVALVNEHQLAPFLASLLSPTSDIKVSHGIVSLLKNLSIPVSNKAVIGSLGVIQAVTPFLAKDKDMVQPLQFGTVGLLKQLCAGVPQNAVQVVEASTVQGGGGENESETPASTLTALLELTKRVDDVPTKLEATRVVVNIIKTLWSSTTAGVSSALISAARQAVVRRDAIQALAEMVRTSPKYPILVNEGIFSLTLVGSEPVGAELVALSLVHEPARQSLASEDDDEDEEMGDAAVVAARAARRRSTHKSIASNGSQPLPPPPAAVDMICSVLARRDARMPPQFAANACMLVLSLIQARGEGNTEELDKDDAIRQTAQRTRSALERLKDQGPIEALEPAARALEAVDAVVGQ